MCTNSELSSINMESVEDTLSIINEIDSKEMDTFDVSHICSEESQTAFKERIKDLEIQLAESKRDANRYLNYCGLIQKLAKENERLTKIEKMSIRKIRNYSRSCKNLLHAIKYNNWQYEQLQIYAAEQERKMTEMQHSTHEMEVYLDKYDQDEKLIAEMLESACHNVCNVGKKLGVLPGSCSDQELDGIMNMAHTIFCASARVNHEMEQRGVAWQGEQMQNRYSSLVNAAERLPVAIEQQGEAELSLPIATEQPVEADSSLPVATEQQGEAKSSLPVVTVQLGEAQPSLLVATEPQGESQPSLPVATEPQGEAESSLPCAIEQQGEAESSLPVATEQQGEAESSLLVVTVQLGEAQPSLLVATEHQGESQPSLLVAIEPQGEAESSLPVATEQQGEAESSLPVAIEQQGEAQLSLPVATEQQGEAESSLPVVTVQLGEAQPSLFVATEQQGEAESSLPVVTVQLGEARPSLLVATEHQGESQPSLLVAIEPQGQAESSLHTEFEKPRKKRSGFLRRLLCCKRQDKPDEA